MKLIMKLSVDGVLRFTVAIKFRCTISDLIDAAAWNASHYGDELPKTRKQAMKMLTDALQTNGTGLWALETSNETRDQAKACIHKLFPELVIKKDANATT